MEKFAAGDTFCINWIKLVLLLMKMGLAKALVPNLKPLQKLKELLSLHLSAQLVGYPGLQLPCARFAVSRRQHQACFRKALCTKFLLN